MPDLTDEQVLADPGSAKVPEVIEVFERSTDEQVLAAQVLEEDGKGRAGILNWTRPDPELAASESATDQPTEPPAPVDPPPAPAQPEPPVADPSPAEASFAIARVLDASEGPRIVGAIESLGRRPSYPEIVGALHGFQGSEITASDVRQRVEAFRGRTVPTPVEA